MSYTLVNPYCSLAQLKDELKRGQSDTSVDDELNEAIVNASRWVDRHMGRDFFFHDQTVTALTFDQFSSKVFGSMVILDWPILTLTEVLVGTTAQTLNTNFCVQGDAPHENRILQRLLSTDTSFLSLSTGRPNEWVLSRPDAILSIKGTFGYVQATSAAIPTGIPSHISHATRLVAAAFSGHNRKQVVAAGGGHEDSFPDGETKVDFIDRSIPRIVYRMLGRQVAKF